MIYYYINNITKIPIIHGKESITGLEYFQFGMSGKRYFISKKILFKFGKEQTVSPVFYLIYY